MTNSQNELILNEEHLQTIRDMIKKRGWRILSYCDMGTTSHIFVIDIKKRKYIIKIPRKFNELILKMEYNVLKYLNMTEMKRYIPHVYYEIPEFEGFIMEFLENSKYDFKWADHQIDELAIALRILHKINISTIPEIKKVSPSIGDFLYTKFKNSFDEILKIDYNHENLLSFNKSTLYFVRSKYEMYVKLLEDFKQDVWDFESFSLIHGDLSGDNIMWKEDGMLTLIDWGESLIGIGLMDIAYLFTYSGWNKEKINRFLDVYYNKNKNEIDKYYSMISLLSSCYLYSSCIKSICIIIDDGQDGLDEFGRKFLEKQILKL